MRALLAERRQLFAASSLAAALVVIRSLVWIFFEQSHFDSDQAIVGLMAKHLAEGRAFPLFFYGQHYMLAVEPWLAAPIFKVAGASVTTLKLPLLGINIAIAVLLLWILTKRIGLKASDAFVASIFFIMPPPLPSARLVEAQGSNIEPLLYVLVLWLLRERPIAFGLFAGFAFLHREFTAYAIAAIVFIDVLTGRLFTRQRWRDYAVAWGMCALVMFVVSLLKTRADLLGPGTAGTMNFSSLDAQVSSWGGFICWSPSELKWNLQWLLMENLGMMFNWKPDRLGPEGWAGVPAGHVWIAAVLTAIVALASVQVARDRQHIGTRWEFCCYVMLIAVEAALAYAVLGCHVRDASLIRYTLLTIYFPIGLAALFFCAAPRRGLRAAMVALVMVWGLTSFVDNARFLAAYLHRPPPSPYRELTTYLETQGVRYGRALYWTAYQVDFFSQERLTVASLEKVRVAEYQRTVDQHGDEAVQILSIRDGCRQGVPFRYWCLINLDRARHVLSAH